MLILEQQQHTSSRKELVAKHKSRQDHYDKILLPLYLHRIKAIDDDPEMSAVDKEIPRHAIPVPTAPILEDQPSPFTTAMELQSSKARDKTCQFDGDADQALQLIRRFMSVRIQNKCSPSSMPPTSRPAEKFWLSGSGYKLSACSIHTSSVRLNKTWQCSPK